MTARVREFFVDGMNYYVPGMQAGADLGQRLAQRLSLGTPANVDPDGILNDQSVAVLGTFTTFAATYDEDDDEKMGIYGRNVTVVASGAATSDVEIVGRDYLGQPMRELLVLNGTTPVAGAKAFRYIDAFVVPEVTAATTVDVGWGAAFGLPYKTVAAEREYADGVVAAAGTLATPDLTDPQTATTDDPRGLYTPTTTPDGAILIEVDAQYSNAVNAAGNGGLHGIRHFNV